MLNKVIYSLVVQVVSTLVTPYLFCFYGCDSLSSNSSQTPPSEAGTNIVAMNTVAIKMLPFWPSDPELWFAQVNAQFMVKNITLQDTKFAHVVAVLSPETATEVRDLILNPPATNPFDVLKDTLNERVSLLKRRKIQAKRQARSPVEVHVARASSSHLLYGTDRHSNTWFLNHTAAEVSVFLTT